MAYWTEYHRQRKKSWVRTAPWTNLCEWSQNMALMIFFENNHNTKMHEKISNMYIAWFRYRTLDPRNRTCVAPPTRPHVQHPYYTVHICEFVDYIYMSLCLILLQWKWMRLNQHDRIRLCSQKFARWKSLRLRSKNTSWCRIGKWHCLKTRRFKTPTYFFRHPRRIFLENFESHCRVRRSAARLCERRAHRDRKLFLRANLL